MPLLKHLGVVIATGGVDGWEIRSGEAKGRNEFWILGSVGNEIREYFVLQICEEDEFHCLVAL